jgi:hypothetical protein
VGYKKIHILEICLFFTLLLYGTTLIATVISIPSLLEPERDIHERDKYRNFDKRPDNRGKRYRGCDAKNGNGNCNSKFKIVGSGRE